MSLPDRIRRQPQWVIVAEALLLAVGVGVADAYAPYDASLFVLYALPILFVVWFSRVKGAGVAVGLVCMGGWIYSEAMLNYRDSYLPVLLLNTPLQLGFVAFILIGGRALKDRLDRSHAEVAVLKPFYLLAEISPIGIFRTDAKGGVIYANRHWLRLAGMTLEEARHQPWTASLYSDDRERVTAEWARTRQEDEPLEFQARFRGRCDAGEEAWALGHVAAERGAHGEIVGFVGAIADVTKHRELEQEVLCIAEREQQRIGQDLHDDLCQFLAAIQYGAASLRTDLQRRGAPEAQEAKELADYLKEAVVRTRHLARRIFPAQLEQAGLFSALHELASSTSRLAGIRCSFEYEPPMRVDDGAATQLYRIAQEALANAIRHGQAKHVTISLEAQRDRLMLTIEDDGIGIPLPLPREREGMGLRIMEYRSHMIGGTLQIEARPGGGTVVQCSFRRSPGGSENV